MLRLHWYLVVALWIASAGIVPAADSAADRARFTTPSLWPANDADTWVATDALGRRVTEPGVALAPRRDRYVGLFYFIWLGAHGYDRNKATPDQSVHPPTAADTESPYDISRLIAANPGAPKPARSLP